MCTRPHVHERLLIDASRLPLDTSDRILSRSWMISKQNDPWPSRELWSLKDGRRALAESRAKLVFIRKLRNTCCACGGPKDDCTHCRVDVDHMFTNANMSRVEHYEVPSLLNRLRARDGSTHVTVMHDQKARGYVGGYLENT